MKSEIPSAPRILGDPAPFDIDAWARDGFSTLPIEETGRAMDDLASVLHSLARPFLRTGYVAGAAVNRGIAGLAAHMDGVQKFVEKSAGVELPHLWEDAAKLYAENAEWHRKRFETLGITALDEIIGEAAGGIVPGVARFMLDVASRGILPYMDGAYRASERGESPFIAGIVEAGKTLGLARLFGMMAPLNLYLKVPSMGTAFGLQAAAEAPEGEKGKAFLKNAPIGAIYAATSPGGRMGLNEVASALKPEIERLVEAYKASPLADQTGAVSLTGGWKKENAPTREDYLDWLDKRIASGKMEKLKPQERDALADAYLSLPIGETLISKQGERILFVPPEGKDPAEYFNQFLTKHSAEQGIDLFRPKYLELQNEIGDTIRNYDDRILAEIPGHDRILYVREFRPVDKKSSHLFVVEAEPSGRLLGWTHLDVNEGYIKNRLNDERALVERRGLLDANGDPSGISYEEYQAKKTEALFYLGNRANADLQGQQGPPVSINDNITPQIEKVKSAGEPAPTTTKPRKFLQTVADAAETDPELAGKVKGIDPQEYAVERNALSRAKAEARIEAEGTAATVDWVKGDAPLSAEKGATFIALIDKFQREGNLDQAVEMVEAYDRQLREAGRFVQAASLWSRLSAPAFVRWANKQLESVRSKYGWMDTLFGRKPDSFTLSKEEQVEILQRVREISQMPDGIEKSDQTLQLLDLVAKKVPPSVSELIDAFRYQNMLSGPRTQLRNIAFNLVSTFLTRPADITTRGAIDWVAAGLTGREREHYVSDAPVYLKAALNAVPNAAEAFMLTLRQGPGATIGKPETGVEARSEFQRRRAEQLPAGLTLVSRFMEACDKFNMALIAGGEMAVSLEKGVDPATAYQRAQETASTYLLRDKLDPNDPRLSYPSKLLASLGKMVENSRSLPVLGPLSSWFVPFIKTPINLGIQITEHTPLGALRKPGSWDAEAGAKILTGSIAMTLGAMLAWNGETTWAPPTGEKEKEMFYASGRKPYSVKIGDTWVPIWYMGGNALAIGLPAAVKHFVEERREAVTEDEATKLLNLVQAVGKFYGQQSSTQSIGALFNALSGDADARFANTAAFTAEQFMPASGFVRWVNAILDPVIRKPSGFLEQIEKDIPGLSRQLAPRRTPFYEESRRELKNAFLPWDVGTSEPLYETLMPFTRFEAREKRIEAKMHEVVKKVKEGKMKPEEMAIEMLKLQMAAPKSVEQLGRELQK